MIHLTHLMFTGDLLLLSRADHISITKIMASFRKFSLAFGLKASIEKSYINLAGVDDARIDEIVHLPIKVFPFKYLGLPLS